LNTAYLNFLATAADTEITHIGLFDDLGVELTGGSPAYARQAVTWTAPSNGLIRPTADLVFDVPAGAVVAEWRGFDAATSGTDYGGELLPNESYTGQGTYTLEAASTGIDHNAA
jgi:hypothetical protein